MRRIILTPVVVAMLMAAPTFGADENPGTETTAGDRRVRIYSTPREKREAGLGTKLTDWLTFFGLVEIEATSIDNRFRNNVRDARADSSVTTVQLAFKAEFDDRVEAEIVLEFEENKSDSILDEAFVELKKGDLGASIGRQTLPFGAYYSHFVTGPLLEFGETKRNTLMLAYEHADAVEFFVFVYDGNAEKVGGEERIRDWGVAVEAELLNNRVLLGASFLSDLADSDEELLSDFDNIYARRVGALSAFAVFRPGRWEISLEGVRATRSFRELDANANEPRSWNVEVAYYPTDNWEIAARFERSDELPDEPETRYGIGVTWLAFKNVSISLEYLQGEYKRGFAFDDDDNELKRQDIIAAQVALEF